MVTQQNGTAVFYASYSYIIAEMSDERERWRDRQVAKDRGLSGYWMDLIEMAMTRQWW